MEFYLVLRSCGINILLFLVFMVFVFDDKTINGKVGYNHLSSCNMDHMGIVSLALEGFLNDIGRNTSPAKIPCFGGVVCLA